MGCYVIYYLSFNVDCVITLDLRLGFVGLFELFMLVVVFPF